MPIFLLTPLSRHADDPDWACSRYSGPCLVMAETEDRARAYASGAFVRPLGGIPGTIGWRPGARAAWMQARLVQARAAPSGGRQSALPLGSVVAAGHACPTLGARSDLPDRAPDQPRPDLPAPSA